jgi:hypothetical protein
MRKYILLLIGLLFLAACEKEDTLSHPGLCDDEYYYYSGGSKIYLKHSLNKVWIEFEQSGITGEMAKSILTDYSFLNTDNFSDSLYYDRFIAIIDASSDCTGFKNYLKELNRNNEIFSATPVFYTSDNILDSYWILLSEVLTENNNELISESDFISYAETLNLELIESKYSTQHFKVEEVETGFEALEIANQIFESGKVHYSHPNFIAKIELH